MPGVPGRREPARRVLTYVAPHRSAPLRAPHLYESLRGFCLGAFAAERGAQVPFAFEEHATREGPSLYEYRPLVRGFVESQAPTLRRLPDARNAIDDLKREPAAAIFARAHAGIGDTGDDALFRSILLPMLTWTAERCGGFDWNDEAFDAAYADLEQTLFGSNRTYVALAPVVGLSAGTDAELGGGITLRPVVSGEISQLWPEAQGLMPPEFGRDVDRLLVLELRRELDPDEADARRCGRRARRRRDGPAAGDRGRDRRRAGRLRAARLPAAADRADPPDRCDAAPRRGGEARQGARTARDGAALEAGARRRRSRAR